MTMWHFAASGVAGLDLYAWDDATSTYRWTDTANVTVYPTSSSILNGAGSSSSHHANECNTLFRSSSIGDLELECTACHREVHPMRFSYGWGSRQLQAVAVPAEPASLQRRCATPHRPHLDFVHRPRSGLCCLQAHHMVRAVLHPTSASTHVCVKLITHTRAHIQT